MHWTNKFLKLIWKRNKNWVSRTYWRFCDAPGLWKPLGHRHPQQFNITPFMPTVAFNICCPRDCVSRHNGDAAGVAIKPLRDDSALRALSSLRGLRGAPEVPPLCRETQSLGRQMLNAPVGINGLIALNNYMFSSKWLTTSAVIAVSLDSNWSVYRSMFIPLHWMFSQVNNYKPV